AVRGRCRACGKRHKNRARASDTVAGENGIVSGMARRYASALFELALESNAVNDVQRDLAALDGLIGGSPAFTRLVRSPVFSAEEQGKALGAILDKAGIGGIAANFLKV